VLLTTQLIEEAERVADRVAIIDRGRLVAVGAPDELVRSAAARAVTVRATGLDPVVLGRAVGAEVETVAGGEHRVLAEPAPALLAAIAAELARQGVLADAISVGGGTLEQVFLDLTASAPAAEHPRVGA